MVPGKAVHMGRVWYQQAENTLREDTSCSVVTLGRCFLNFLLDEKKQAVVADGADLCSVLGSQRTLIVVNCSYMANALIIRVLRYLGVTFSFQ